MSLMYISHLIDPMILMYWFQFMLMLTRRTTVAADRQPVIVIFRIYGEVTILGISCGTVPILELHTKSVRFVRGETMQQVVPKPVFTSYITKALLIFVPGLVKIQSSVSSSLEYLCYKFIETYLCRVKMTS